MDNSTESNYTVDNTPPEAGYNNIPNNQCVSGNNNPNNNFNPGYINNNNNFNNQNSYMAPPIIDSLSGWMKFIGIYTIVVGAISCIGIITAAFGIPMIFSGIGLTNASKSLKSYNDYNNQFTLNEFFTYLNKYFKIQGIFVIIGIALSVIYIAFLLIVIIVGLYSINSY